MRIICCFLAFIVVLLSVKPCCADVDCTVQRTQCVADHSSSSSHKDDCKGCSPFFSCGSCTGFTITAPHIMAASIVSAEPVLHVSRYVQPALKDVSKAIWQPPQLG